MISAPFLRSLILLLSVHIVPGIVGALEIIVHESNPTESLTKTQLEMYFLKKERNWMHGPTVVPVDQVQTLPVRRQFSKEIIGRPVASVKAFWRVLVFSGRTSPPRELESDSEVIDFVERNPGAIGYVSILPPLGPRVRSILISK